MGSVSYVDFVNREDLVKWTPTTMAVGRRDVCVGILA